MFSSDGHVRHERLEAALVVCEIYMYIFTHIYRVKPSVGLRRKHPIYMDR